jgi:hypothetical protein
VKGRTVRPAPAPPKLHAIVSSSRPRPSAAWRATRAPENGSIHPRACGPGGFGAGSTTVHLPRPACSTSPVFSSRSSDSTVEQRGRRSRSWLFRELQRFARRWDKARQLRHPRRRRRHLRSNGCEVLPCEFAVRCVLTESEMAISWPYGQPPPQQQGFAFATKLLERLAPRAGLEPATIRLTVECSTS